MKIQDLILPAGIFAAIVLLFKPQEVSPDTPMVVTTITEAPPVIDAVNPIVTAAQKFLEFCRLTHTAADCDRLLLCAENPTNYTKCHAVGGISLQEINAAILNYRGLAAAETFETYGHEGGAAELTMEILSRVGDPGTRTIYYPETGQLTVTTTEPGEYRSTGGRLVPSYVEGGEPVPFEWQGEYNL